MVRGLSVSNAPFHPGERTQEDQPLPRAPVVPLGHPAGLSSGQRVPAGLAAPLLGCLGFRPAQIGPSTGSSLLSFASNAGKSPDDRRGHGCGCSEGSLLLLKHKC